MFDTSVLISTMRENKVLLARLGKVEPTHRFISSLSHFELWYGVAKSRLYERNRDRLNAILREFDQWIDFNDADAKAAGEIRASLERGKQPIGPYDTLIAGQALARGLTLVTANEREFRRVKGLRVENWER